MRSPLVGLAQLALFALMAAQCVMLGAEAVTAAGACPRTKPKNVACKFQGYNGTCAGANQTLCEQDRKLMGQVNEQPLEDQSNGSNETKTKVETAEDGKVTCYTYNQCKWRPVLSPHCYASSSSTPYQVNPLVQVNCD